MFELLSDGLEYEGLLLQILCESVCVRVLRFLLGIILCLYISEQSDSFALDQINVQFL